MQVSQLELSFYFPCIFRKAANAEIAESAAAHKLHPVRSASIALNTPRQNCESVSCLQVEQKIYSSVRTECIGL
jgi:hypothetical protein